MKSSGVELKACQSRYVPRAGFNRFPFTMGRSIRSCFTIRGRLARSVKPILSTAAAATGLRRLARLVQAVIVAVGFVERKMATT